MTSTAAQHIVNALEGIGAMTGASAAHIVAIWLKDELGATPNRWGKYEVGPDVRWEIAARTVHKQKRGSSGWFNVKSYQLVDMAIQLATLAEEAVGKPGKAATMKTGRASAKAAAESKAAEKALREQASTLAAKYMAFAHPKEVLANLRRETLPADEFAKLAQQSKDVIAEYLEGLKAGKAVPSDNDYANADRPPVLPIFRKINYNFDAMQDGVEYSVRIEHADSNTARVHIGAVGSGFLQVDPLSHTMHGYYGPPLKGDGNADCLVTDDHGQLHARLFMVTTTTKRTGAGTRMLKIWCRLMHGYGIKAWLGEAVGDEGMRFLKGLQSKGAIRIEAERDGYLLVSCE